MSKLVRYQGGKAKPSNQIDIATYQSLINRVNNSIKPIAFKFRTDS